MCNAPTWLEREQDWTMGGVVSIGESRKDQLKRKLFSTLDISHDKVLDEEELATIVVALKATDNPSCIATVAELLKSADKDQSNEVINQHDLSVWFDKHEFSEEQLASLLAAVEVTIQTKVTSRPQRKIFVLFGPPASGKGTQGLKLQEIFDVPIISTGSMLRSAEAAGSALGERVKNAVAGGELIEDEEMIRVVAERLMAPDCTKGFILDGFPRTLPQAVALESILATGGDVLAASSASQCAEAGGFVSDEPEPAETLTAVISLEVPDSKLEERACGRWVHEKSGRSYHVSFSPPESLVRAGKDALPLGGEEGNMKDNETGDCLVQRRDDNPESHKERLLSYHHQTAPLIAHYAAKEGMLVRVDANQGPDLVWKEICTALKISK
jgi:adenylate kinase